MKTTTTLRDLLESSTKSVHECPHCERELANDRYCDHCDHYVDHKGHITYPEDMTNESTLSKRLSKMPTDKLRKQTSYWQQQHRNAMDDTSKRMTKDIHNAHKSELKKRFAESVSCYNEEVEDKGTRHEMRKQKILLKGKHVASIHTFRGRSGGWLSSVHDTDGKDASKKYGVDLMDTKAEMLKKIKAYHKGVSEGLKDPAKMSGAALSDHLIGADQISKDKEGHHTIYQGFFYRSGSTSEGHANRISKGLDKLGIKHTVVDHGTQDYRPFRGGASVKTQNHHWVKVKIHPGQKVHIED